MVCLGGDGGAPRERRRSFLTRILFPWELTFLIEAKEFLSAQSSATLSFLQDLLWGRFLGGRAGSREREQGRDQYDQE